MLKYRELSLLKRNKKKSKKITYDLVLVIHTKISDKIVVKLGSYDKNTKILVINIFRLVYWFSKNCYMSYRLMRLFNNINLFNFNKNIF